MPPGGDGTTRYNGGVVAASPAGPGPARPGQSPGSPAATGSQDPDGPLGAEGTPSQGRHIPGVLPPHPRCYPRSASPDRSEPALLAIFNDTVTSWIVDNGYVAVFVLMLLESACVPIPAEVTMLVGGALASTGFAGEGQELSLILVILAGTGGNLVGSWVAYAGGAVGGRPLLERFGRYLLVRPHEVDRAHDWFERHGEAAVFFGRLLPVIRTFISLPAGIARMNLWKFTVYTVLGCLPFVSVIAWLGYRAGANWEQVEHTLQPFSWLIAIAVLAFGAAFVARRWRSVRAEYAALDTLRRQVEEPAEAAEAAEAAEES